MSRTRQTAIGLTLAAAIIGGWVALHVYAVFFLRLSPASAWTVAPLVLLQSWLGAGMFIVAHDAMHGSLAPGRPRLNTALGQLALGLYAGFPYRELLVKHHLHHRHAGREGDPDFHPGAPRAFWPWYIKFFREYWGWPQQLAITGALLLYVFVFRADPLNAAVFWGLPAILSSLQLFVFGTWLPHRHDDAAFVDRHNSRTLGYGWIASLFTCFHFGYHLEHHHSPTTPWWGLPRYRREAATTSAAGFIPR